MICVGKLYNQRSAPPEPGDAAISRYAWGQDYHDLMRASLEAMVVRLKEHATFDWKICVDTAPLAGADLRASGGSRMDRQEYLSDQ